MTMTKNEIINLFATADALPYRSDMKKYKKGHIFDENKSVKWNAEEVDRRNEAYEEEIRKEAFREAERKLRNFLYEEYSTSKLSPYQIDKIYNYVYEEYHSYGLSEVFIHMDDLVELINEIIFVR